MTTTPLVTRKKIKSEFAGSGCLIQAVGLILLFVFPIGTIIGIPLLIYGGISANKLVCKNCGNPVTKAAKICPVCHARFEKGRFGR